MLPRYSHTDLCLWPQPVAYLSKKLDPVVAGWPPCLRALVATVLIIKEANKLTLGQELNVKFPHAVVSLMNTQGHRFLSNSQLAQCQGLLCENPRIAPETVWTLNPETSLPSEEGKPVHGCSELTDEVFASLPDLCDQARQNTYLTLFGDDSSFITEGVQKPGYAMTCLNPSPHH